MNYTIHQFINGASYQDKNAKQHPIYNPALGEMIGHVEFATVDAVDHAISTAKKAFTTWATTPPIKRSRILFKFKELLEAYQDDLAQLVTQEHGKTLEDARGSVWRGIELVEYMCGIPQQLRGTFSENVANNIDSYTLRQPLGICAGISPFNFPVMVPLWMMIPAIACGNCFILKPSEQDPSAPMRLAELLSDAGLPNGVLSILNGDKTVVDALLHHPDIHAVTAVASTPVAQMIYQTAIQNGKRSHTFGGAKNHCIVMPDADPEQTAEVIAGAALGSAGERCMAISVAVVVGDKMADQLVAALIPKFTHLKIGAGNTPGMEMGPLISAAHLKRVTDYIDLGIKEGATLVYDGRAFKHEQYPAGFFMGPTLFDKVTPDMRIYQEEIFGPVLEIVRVADYDNALRLINDNPYGNGTAIFTHDGDTARTFASQVNVGMVGINIPIPVPVAYHPFGGWKKSVFGDIGMHGEQSIQFYTKLKSVTARWPKGIRQTSHYAMPSDR